MKYVVILSIILWQSFFLSSWLNAAEADIFWARAVHMVKEGQPDMAFSNFSLITHSYPHFKKTLDAQFSLGEYYFYQDIPLLASQEFEKFYRLYPKQKETLIALAFLYKMANIQGNQQLMKRYQKELIASYQLAFIFKNSKTFDYLSGYQHRYKAVFYIDKVEVFVDGSLFITIPC